MQICKPLLLHVHWFRRQWIRDTRNNSLLCWDIGPLLRQCESIISYIDLQNLLYGYSLLITHSFSFSTFQVCELDLIFNFHKVIIIAPRMFLLCFFLESFSHNLCWSSRHITYLMKFWLLVNFRSPARKL